MMKLKKSILFSFRKSQIGWLLIRMHLFHIIKKNNKYHEMNTLVPKLRFLFTKKWNHASL